MASTLASQLQQLAAAQNPGAAAKPKFRGKASLLFDFQKAADVDVQSIFEIACQGQSCSVHQYSTDKFCLHVETGTLYVCL